MDPTVDCIPCFLEQVLGMIEEVSLEDNSRDRIVEHGLEESRAIMKGRPTPIAMRNVMEKLDSLTNGSDPYREFKKRSTETALELLPELRQLVNDSSEPFTRAVEFSIAGNAIDLAVVEQNELEEIASKLENLDKTKFTVNQIGKLKNQLDSAEEVLVLGDNAGETVFDRLLLERIEAEQIYYSVRGYPILNDATEKEARESGVDKHANLISTGQRIPGVALDEAPDEFLKLFNSADVVLAKGQGNFETLISIPRPVFHLFKVKCDVVSKQVDGDLDDFMVWEREATR